MTDQKISDAEARAQDQARVGGGPVAANDAVERRAVGGSHTVIRNRRAEVDAEVPRAESRGIYSDLQGRRRVVGAGQPIPDGWDRIESATISDRVGKTATNLEDGEQSGGAGDPPASSSSKPSRSRK